MLSTYIKSIVEIILAGRRYYADKVTAYFNLATKVFLNLASLGETTAWQY